MVKIVVLSLDELQALMIDSFSACLKYHSIVSSANQNSTKRWLNIAELCEYIPDKPAKATVYAWVSNSTIPFHKKGKKLFFSSSEIDEWLNSGRKKTRSEVEAEAINSISAKKKGANHA